MEENNSVLLSEKNSSTGKEYYYVQPSGQSVVKGVSLDSNASIKRSLSNVFKEIFLPQGYPSSVSEDYAAYQVWDTAQAFCSTITGILATQSVMKGVGVGDTEATPLAATITWVLKDGTGHIGRIGFAWWKGTSLDADSKKWRLIADGLNDMAICLELLLPLFHGYTTYVLCLTTAMKAIVGVAGGATRAALTQHQAVRGNLADVSAKDGSQETAVNLCASMIAILILSLVERHLWFIFLIFTVFHLISNYFAVTSVCLKTFNRERFIHFLDEYFTNGEYLKPTVVNKEESVFFGYHLKDKHLCGCDIIIGHSIKKLISTNKINLKELKEATRLYEKSNYLILVDITKQFYSVVFNEDAKSEDILKSYYHAAKLARRLTLFQDLEVNDTVCGCLVNKCNESDCKNCKKYAFLSIVKEEVDRDWIVFYENTKSSGWNVDHQLILYEEWRAKW